MPPSFAWIPEKIVETSPDDSAYAYDLNFAVGVDGGTEYVLDPLGEALVDPGVELASMTDHRHRPDRRPAHRAAATGGLTRGSAEAGAGTSVGACPG